MQNDFSERLSAPSADLHPPARLSKLLYHELLEFFSPSDDHINLPAIDGHGKLTGRWYAYLYRPFFFQRGADSIEVLIESETLYNISLDFIYNDINKGQMLFSQQVKLNRLNEEYSHWKVDSDNLNYFEKRVLQFIGKEFYIPFFDEKAEILIICSKNLKYYWVLGRQAKIEKVQRKRLLSTIERLGFEVQNLTVS